MPVTHRMTGADNGQLFAVRTVAARGKGLAVLAHSIDSVLPVIGSVESIINSEQSITECAAHGFYANTKTLMPSSFVFFLGSGPACRPCWLSKHRGSRTFAADHNRVIDQSARALEYAAPWNGRSLRLTPRPFEC